MITIIALACAVALATAIARLYAPAAMHRRLSAIRELSSTLAVSGIAALLIVELVARPYFIPSLSMAATLEVHDVLLVDKLAYRFSTPQHGDIAVFKAPIASTDDLIKRVVGVPGDRIAYHGGVLTRNGVMVSEPYAERPQYDFKIANYGFIVDGVPLSPEIANIPPRSAWSAPDRVPANCYLMFGDNRNDSYDSHAWGCAQTSGTFASGALRGQPAHFTGRADLLMLPLSRSRSLVYHDYPPPPPASR